MACLSRKRFRTNLTIRYWGECCIDDCQHEPSGMSLCDDTQTTHDNWCKFRYNIDMFCDLFWITKLTIEPLQRFPVLISRFKPTYP